ncbi:MAG: pilus assembly protein TadA [Bradymonadales bacterium]|nr:MAG: pilus assembly protein TadA [Bradymonadales bacterium]
MGILIAVTGGKDGVGKTTLSLHLAYSLLKNAKQRTCLIEADPYNFGDLSVLLASKQIKSFTDFCSQVGRMDSRLAANWAGAHPTGLSLMSAANFPKDFQNLEDENVIKALQLLKRAFDVVVIDAGRDINPLSFRVFENSDLIFLVTDADIISANRTGELLKNLRSLHFGNESFRVIINRFEQKSVVNPSTLKQKFNLDAKILLPTDSAGLQQSVSMARPLHAINPKSPYLIGLDQALRAVHPFLQGGSSGTVVTGKNQSLEVLNSLLPFRAAGAGASLEVPARGSIPDPIKERNLRIRTRVHERLLELVDLREMDPLELERDPKKKEELKSKTVQAIHQLLEQEAKDVSDRQERALLAQELVDEALGLGPIEALLRSESVSEIMVNGKDMIYVEQNGKLTLSDLYFTGDKQLLGCIERILMPIGRRVDEKTPLADGRLRDGSRINVIIPPLALSGPTLTIRKFFKEKLQVEDLVRFGSLTDEMGDFLRAAVEAKLNVVVSGGTGTGKTTLLNLVSGFIPNDERIVTVEDAAELQLPQDHVITLETKPANLQGEGSISIRDLVRNSLRMRPDRIVVGECRGGEALDMLQAMNTGHDGSLTTVHANNPRDCLRRLETLVMMAGFDLPMVAIREQIASAVNLIVQLRRYSDGTRKISHITEVMGLEGETMVTQPIFEFKQTGTNEKGKVIGNFQPSGLIPKFVESLKAKGISLPKGLFGGGALPNRSSDRSSSSETKQLSQSDSKSKTEAATPEAPMARKPVGSSKDEANLSRSSPSRGFRPPAPVKKNPARIPTRNPHGGKKP